MNHCGSKERAFANLWDINACWHLGGTRHQQAGCVAKARIQVVPPLTAECGGPGLVWYEWKQRQMPGTLNGQPQSALVFGADTRPAARFYLRSVRNESPDAIDIFIIDVFDMVHTECTDSPSRSKPPPATSSKPTSAASWWRPASWSSRWWCGHIKGNPPVKTSEFSRNHVFVCFGRNKPYLSTF